MGYYSIVVWLKTIDLAPRPSQILVCDDRDVNRRYTQKIEPAACNVIWRVRRLTPTTNSQALPPPPSEKIVFYKLGPPSANPVKTKIK